MSLDRSFTETAAIRSQLGAIFVSLELRRSTWLTTSLSPGSGENWEWRELGVERTGSGEKLSKHAIEGGDVSGLLARLAELRRKALAREAGRAIRSRDRGSGAGRLLASSALAGAGLREPCGRSGLDRGAAPTATGQDGSARWRGVVCARCSPTNAGRTSGLLDGWAADARGRGRAAGLSRAGRTDRGAGSARQSDQGAFVLAGGRRL